MSLLSIANDIQESCYQRKVRERKATSYYKTEESIKQHESSVAAIKSALLNAGVIINEENIWDSLFGEDDSKYSGLAYLPQENLNRILEEPMCCRGMTLTDVYTSWNKRGFLTFVPYIIYQDTTPFLVFDVLGFAAFDGTRFGRYVFCDLQTCVTYSDENALSILRAQGVNAYLRTHPIGAAVLLSQLMTELSNQAAGARAAFEHPDVLFEFVKSATKEYDCNFDFPIEGIYKLYEYTPASFNIFPQAIVNEDGNMLLPFTITDKYVAAYSLSDVACFKKPNFCGVADNAEERNDYIRCNKITEYMFILSLHMQGIHCRPRGIYAPDIKIRREAPALIEHVYDGLESILNNRGGFFYE